MSWIFDILIGFTEGLLAIRPSRRTCQHEEKELRYHLAESQIDKMLADSFPASDPPSTY